MRRLPLIIFFTSVLFGIAEEDFPVLSLQRKNWEEARITVQAEIDKSYLARLKELKKYLVKKGDFDTARAFDKAIKREAKDENEPASLTNLRKTRDKALKTAFKPIDKQYWEDLKLLKGYAQRQGDLEQVESVISEINRVLAPYKQEPGKTGLKAKPTEKIKPSLMRFNGNPRSLFFDGIDDYMSMTLPVLGNTHTLSAWFKANKSHGSGLNEGSLVSYVSSGGGNDDSVLSVASDNKLQWSDFVDNNLLGSTNVNDGKWHHAVAVITASSQKLYLDGSLNASATDSYSAGNTFSNAAIGRRANAAQRYFGGNIDEVAIWNSELSASDVTAIYNGGRPVNLNRNANGYDNSSTLVAWWRMGDNESGSSSNVTDNSHNKHKGALINGPTFQRDTPDTN